jgi:fructose-1,6-bisphosphatase
VDGHERDDVVAVTISHNDVRKNLVLIFHDESIFNTNEGQTWIWGIGDQSYVHSAQDQRSRNHGQRFYNSKHWIPPTE